MEELKRVVSTPFKKNLASSLSEKDFEFSLAFDLKWFSPKTALKVKDRALEEGLLSLKNGLLVPEFDLDSIRLPHAFKPAEDFLENKDNIPKKTHVEKEISFEQILEFISADRGISKQRLASEINAMQDKLFYLVDIRVVALIVAKKLGCNIETLFDRVAKSVLGFNL